MSKKFKSGKFFSRNSWSGGIKHETLCIRRFRVNTVPSKSGKIDLNALRRLISDDRI
jgi:hypothetical protein